MPLQTLEVGANIRSMLVAQVAVFLQSLVDDVFQLRRHIGIQPHKRYGCPVQDRIEDGRGTVTTEWQLPGGHLIEDGSKREKISAGIKFLPTCLLRRHIGDGAESTAGTGQMLV